MDRHSFSEQLPTILAAVRRIGGLGPASNETTRQLLEKAVSAEGLEIDEVATLVYGLEKAENAASVLEFARAQRRPNDDQVLLLPPLYFSSICENHCAYCDFSTGDGIRLSHDEFAAEVDSLVALGYRSIELVSSQDPELYVRLNGGDPTDQRFELSAVARYFEILRQRLRDAGDGMIISNIPPVCSDGFDQLRDAGLDCFLAWLETFEPEQYARLHSGQGPKSDQAFRLDSFERAKEAGIEHVAGAYLKGLHDWRQEEVVLYAFDRHLRDRWGRGFSIIGTPRVKGRFAGSRLIHHHQMSDAVYELNIALDRILFDGVQWLQTRESFAMNRRLLARYGGGAILTLTCSTAPGGYAHSSVGDPQFPVHDQDLDGSIRELTDSGLSVRFDWGAHDLTALQRVR
jgi:2-iminoacetate synthase